MPKVTIDWTSDLDKYYEEAIARLRERWRIEHPRQAWRGVKQQQVDGQVSPNAKRRTAKGKPRVE